MSLDPVQAELQMIKRRLEPGDWTLQHLMRLADKGLGISVTLLFDGVLIKGDLARVEEWAEHVDEGIDSAMRGLIERAQAEQGPVERIEDVQVDRIGPGDLEWLRVKLEEGGFTRRVQERRDFEADLEKQLQELGEQEQPQELHDLPEALARALIDVDAPLNFVTLQNVTVARLGGPEARLEMLRVATERVSAWWLGR